MKTTIKIKFKKSEDCYFLLINGCAISMNCDAIIAEFGVPYGACRFGSIKSIRNFWANHRELICYNSENRKFESVWGQLVPVNK